MVIKPRVSPRTRGTRGCVRQPGEPGVPPNCPLFPSAAMNLRFAVLGLLLPVALLGRASAQVQPPPPPLPARGPAPLLYVRFSGPAGMRATFFQGRPNGRTFDAPV